MRTTYPARVESSILGAKYKPFSVVVRGLTKLIHFAVLHAIAVPLQATGLQHYLGLRRPASSWSGLGQHALYRSPLHTYSKKITCFLRMYVSQYGRRTNFYLPLPSDGPGATAAERASKLTVIP